jgi:bacterioferritin-associated ferredoxin
MYVCVCHAVTEKEILAAARRGVTRLADLRRELKVPGDCGRCAKHAKAVLAGAQTRIEPCWDDLLTGLQPVAIGTSIP